jgi:phosphatidylinositol-3-phosphatase
VGSRRSAIAVHSQPESEPKIQAMTIRSCLVGLLMAVMLPGLAHARPWRPAHVVVVIEENHGYEQIIGNPDAAFINELAADGALLTNSHGIQHPSQPNYLALFSGSTQGVTDDKPVPGTPLTGPNLGAALIAKGYTFAGYSEGLPAIGSFSVAAGGIYARKHNPWSNWQSDNPGPNQLPARVNMRLADFPSTFEALPTVAFVVPGLTNDEHGNGQIADADLIRASDRWLKRYLGAYASWTIGHDSLLIVTWDEDDYTMANRIPTILVGAQVKPGMYDQTIAHYNVLRMIEGFYDLPLAGASADATPIADAVP